MRLHLKSGDSREYLIRIYILSRQIFDKKVANVTP